MFTMKTQCITILCILFVIGNPENQITGGLSDLIPLDTLYNTVKVLIPASQVPLLDKIMNLNLSSDYLTPILKMIEDSGTLCNAPLDIILKYKTEEALNCSLPGSDSFAGTSSTVSSGSLALRYYNGNDADTSIEIILPITDGTVLANLPGFDNSKNTLFYYFGYKENINSVSVHVIVQAYIAHGGYNIFVVDWSGIGCQDSVTAVLGCSSEVPHEVANAIKQLLQSGYSKDLLEVVGHSLGAQCAGAMGRNEFSGSLPIIVGLDPAGPSFTCINGLHEGDASFVQVIHTDRENFGTYFVCGEFDVFLNDDGFRHQPGCKCVFPPISFTFTAVCSHHLSWKTYAASVRGAAQFYCSKCNCYEDFRNGNCDTPPLVALYGASRSSKGNCYMKTSGTYPYGLGTQGAHY